MYRRPKFLELLLEIRQDMALEADHEVDQFVQNLGDMAEPQKTPVNPDTVTGEVRLNGSEITKAAVTVPKR